MDRGKSIGGQNRQLARTPARTISRPRTAGAAGATRAAGEEESIVAAQRILICFHDFSRGGTERIAIRLARQWVDAGREVTMLVGAPDGGARADIDPRIRIVMIDPPIARGPISRLRLGPAMAAMLPALAPDIVFLPGNFHLWLAPPLARARAAMPHPRPAIVVKISNPAVPRGWLALPLAAIMRRYRYSIDGVATMNSGLERDLKALLPGIDARTLLDPVYLDPDPSPRVPRIPGAPLHIVWAGRLERQKDPGLALQVIAALNRIVPARLTLLGEGSGARNVARAIARDGLADIVDAPGHVAAIDPWLARADALLITSHFEGGPAVAVEALAHGVPVVSTDCSHFLHDLLTDPVAGAIVASRDPQALAQAIAVVCARGRPDPAALQALIAHLNPQARGLAYLAWFDDIAARR